MPKDFLSFARQAPREAALIQTAATQAVLKAQQMPGLTDVQLQEVAEQLAIEYLQKAYRAVPWFGKIPLLDALAVNYLIPHLPGAVRGVLAFINETQE